MENVKLGMLDGFLTTTRSHHKSLKSLFSRNKSNGDDQDSPSSAVNSPKPIPQLSTLANSVVSRCSKSFSFSPLFVFSYLHMYIPPLFFSSSFIYIYWFAYLFSFTLDRETKIAFIPVTCMSYGSQLFFILCYVLSPRTSTTFGLRLFCQLYIKKNAAMNVLINFP